MMRRVTRAAVLAIATSLLGCVEQVVIVEGTVVSAEDGLPLDGTRVLFREAGNRYVVDSTLTDTTGAFDLGTFTACCVKADIEVLRAGYEPYRQTFDSSTYNVRLTLRRLSQEARP